MAFQIGEDVYVPWNRLRAVGEQEPAFALYRTRVEEVVGGRVPLIRVRLPSGQQSRRLRASDVHRNPGVLLLAIGDLRTETTLLNPLNKSVLQYLRLLLPDDMISRYFVRTGDELKLVWEREGEATSHVILLGHGSRYGLRFADGDTYTPDDLEGVLPLGQGQPRLFISLACHTGAADFARGFSRLPVSAGLIAPFQAVHGAVASQFCQTFLALHFIEGRTTRAAWSGARERAVGGTSFRLWQNGGMADHS